MLVNFFTGSELTWNYNCENHWKCVFLSEIHIFNDFDIFSNDITNSTGTLCPGRWWSLLPWRYSRPAWTRSCAACCRWPCFSL